MNPQTIRRKTARPPLCWFLDTSQVLLTGGPKKLRMVPNYIFYACSDGYADLKMADILDNWCAASTGVLEQLQQSDGTRAVEKAAE